MNSPLSEKVIEVALRNLRIMGCKYIVVKGDGNILIEGDLELAVPKPRRHSKKINNFKATGYIDILKSMIPGDEYTFEMEGNWTAEQFQKSVSAQCYELFGTGNYRTHANRANNTLAVVCLAIDPARS